MKYQWLRLRIFNLQITLPETTVADTLNGWARVGRCFLSKFSGQIIATSHDLGTPQGNLVKYYEPFGQMFVIDVFLHLSQKSAGRKTYPGLSCLCFSLRSFSLVTPGKKRLQNGSCCLSLSFFLSFLPG